MIDLSLVLEDEIWDELTKRYDGVILATLKSVNKDSDEVQVSYHGGRMTAIGLAEKVRHEIFRAIDADKEALDEEHQP